GGSAEGLVSKYGGGDAVAALDGEAVLFAGAEGGVDALLQALQEAAVVDAAAADDHPVAPVLEADEALERAEDVVRDGSGDGGDDVVWGPVPELVEDVAQVGVRPELVLAGALGRNALEVAVVEEALEKLVDDRALFAHLAVLVEFGRAGGDEADGAVDG